MGKLLYLPGAEQLLEEQASTNQAKRLKHTLLSSLSEARHTVQKACVPFALNGDLRPIHCRNALNALEDLGEYIQTVDQIFQGPAVQETDIFSALASSLYPILTPLYHAQEQISLLIDLIDSHRLLCSTPSQQSRRQRRVIQEQCTTLDRYLVTLSEQLRSLDDDVLLRKQR